MTPLPPRQYLSSPPCGYGCVFCFPEQVVDPCEDCNIRIPHKKHPVAKDVGRVAYEVLKEMYNGNDGSNEFVHHNYLCGQAHMKLLGKDERDFDHWFLDLGLFGKAYCFTLRGDPSAASFRARTLPRIGCLDHPLKLDEKRKKARLQKVGEEMYQNSVEKTFIDPWTAEERPTRFGERLSKIARRNWYITGGTVLLTITLCAAIGIMLIIII